MDVRSEKGSFHHRTSPCSRVQRQQQTLRFQFHIPAQKHPRLLSQGEKQHRAAMRDDKTGRDPTRPTGRDRQNAVHSNQPGHRQPRHPTCNHTEAQQCTGQTQRHQSIMEYQFTCEGPQRENLQPRDVPKLNIQKHQQTSTRRLST